MQTIAQKSALRGSVAARPARLSRTAVVVRAAAEESRRSVLAGFVAGVVTLSASSAFALTPVDLIDDRAVKATGFDAIYEARDASLTQAQRAGFAQSRAALDETKARIKVSENRIDSTLEPSIKKSYWTEAREELRRQVGTLRFDLNVLAETKPKEEKKKAQALKKDFISKVEALDYALRTKNQSAALSALESTKQGLDAVLAALV